jgi:hypothetical protein
MTTTLSIRELTRNGAILGNYDYVDIEDRKSHLYKGVFVPERHAKLVKDYLEKKIQQVKQQKLENLMQFAGVATGSIGDRTIQSIKADKGKHRDE